LRRDTVEDSANLIRATQTAGVRIIAIPNRRYRPPADALVLADVALGSVSELTPGTVAAV
jgi:beta-phosphoglucomutase-like phosphatase (HAD superfamily)